jgi:peroxiredoxin
MLPIGTLMPRFRLPNIDGVVIDSESFKGAPATLVIFACNHCPFVVHVNDEIAKIANEYSQRGVVIVAINANDTDEYPMDSPENMRKAAEEWGWNFPYLFDESQEVAKEFRAACTPDFYLFDADGLLVYRGQLDDSRPNNGKPVNGVDLRHALDAVLSGEMPDEDQQPSIGCSIKWKPGNAPDFALSQL